MPQEIVANMNHSGRGGGRIASDQYRQSLRFSEQFAGLEETTSRYDLLLLVKRVGKLAGFTPRMIQLLDYYMAYTTELDWEEGSQPIVYQSLSRTALDLGVTERQIQKLEKQLFDVGTITWNDSGNHKRYGKRDPATGRLLYAYGIDLSPLASLKAELEEKLHEKQLYNQAWQATKREISSLRRQIRSLVLEWQQEEGADRDLIQRYEQRYQEIAFQLRSHINLQNLRSLLDRHQAFHAELIAKLGGGGNRNNKQVNTLPIAKKAAKSSCRNEHKFVHNKYSNLNKNNCSPADKGFQKSNTNPTEPKNLKLAAGLQHINRRQVLLASSERFRSYLPLKPRPMNWNDITEAAFRVRAELKISQQSWGEACSLLGREGASICILLTDRATARPVNRVRQPTAYFQEMIRRARLGELRLTHSLFGHIERISTQSSGS